MQFSFLLAWIPAVLVHYGNIPAAVAWILFALLMIALALYPGLACAVTGISVRRAAKGLVLVFPFAWVTTEVLRSFTLFGGFPWMLTGYSQTDNLRIIQIAISRASTECLSSSCVSTWGLHGCSTTGSGKLTELPAGSRRGRPGDQCAWLTAICSLQRWDGLPPGTLRHCCRAIFLRTIPMPS